MEEIKVFRSILSFLFIRLWFFGPVADLEFEFLVQATEMGYVIAEMGIR